MRLVQEQARVGAGHSESGGCGHHKDVARNLVFLCIDKLLILYQLRAIATSSFRENIVQGSAEGTYESVWKLDQLAKLEVNSRSRSDILVCPKVSICHEDSSSLVSQQTSVSTIS